MSSAPAENTQTTITALPLIKDKHDKYKVPNKMFGIKSLSYNPLHEDGKNSLQYSTKSISPCLILNRVKMPIIAIRSRETRGYSATLPSSNQSER